MYCWSYCQFDVGCRGDPSCFTPHTYNADLADAVWSHRNMGNKKNILTQHDILKEYGILKSCVHTMVRIKLVCHSFVNCVMSCLTPGVSKDTKASMKRSDFTLTSFTRLQTLNAVVFLVIYWCFNNSLSLNLTK